MNDTIFALSSGQPPAGIAIIRVSGPRALEAGTAVAGSLPKPRLASLRQLVDPDSGEPIDQAVVLASHAPHSATGENMVEFQCHGGIAVTRAMLQLLARRPGLREAEPGEFTRRALANGLIDLTQAEGLADLLEAETERQRQVALIRAGGALRQEIEEIQTRLLHLAAALEHQIDYADEEVDEGSTVPAAMFETVADPLRRLLDAPSVERLRHGVRVVVAGPPNAGKSSLVNALAREERAIVTPIPGTTRDIIEVPLAFAGQPVVLVDTAGLREAGDSVEQIGIERATKEVERADLLLWLGEIEEAPNGAILVSSKIDLMAPRPDTIGVSSKTGEGLDQLHEILRARASRLLPPSNALALTHFERSLLTEALEAVEQAVDAVAVEVSADFIRRAREFLDRISGRADVEAMLGALFGRFCVGK